MSNYSKFKDSDPRDTVFRIQKILNNAGIMTGVSTINNSYSGACSHRISIDATDLGTNGKGTDEMYSLASGYAELMERLQNNLIALRMPRRRVMEHGDFRSFPDERIMTISEVIEQKDPFMEHVFELMGYKDPLRKNMFVSRFVSYTEECSDDKATCIPYADISGDRIVYLPEWIVLNVVGSNGMAAGNTIEEAMVQGMCEIYERHVNFMILKGLAVPPAIPDEELKKYSFWDMIEEIEAGGRYRVSVRDGSLGKGLPVAVTIISDTDTGSFGVRLGSHPSMAVAAERTLTEIFQGRDLEGAVNTCSFGSTEESTGYHNMPNTMKIGAGIYPASLLSGTPGWEYRPWTEWEGLDNPGFLRKMLAMAERDGLDVLVRDNSHMGFPAVQILIPGYSDMYQVCGTWYRGINTGFKAVNAFSHFPDLTEDEKRSLLNIIKFKEYSAIENTIQAIAMRPFRGDALHTDKLAAFVAVSLGKYSDAHHFLSKLIWKFQQAGYEYGGELQYYHALDNYCRGCISGLESEAAVKLVSGLFRENIASRVRDDACDPEGILRRNFPETRCFDCEHCPLSGEGCSNAAEEEVMMRVKDAMKDSKVSQTELLERIKCL